MLQSFFTVTGTGRRHSGRRHSGRRHSGRRRNSSGRVWGEAARGRRASGIGLGSRRSRGTRTACGPDAARRVVRRGQRFLPQAQARVLPAPAVFARWTHSRRVRSCRVWPCPVRSRRMVGAFLVLATRAADVAGMGVSSFGRSRQRAPLDGASGVLRIGFRTFVACSIYVACSFRSMFKTVFETFSIARSLHERDSGLAAISSALGCSGLLETSFMLHSVPKPSTHEGTAGAWSVGRSSEKSPGKEKVRGGRPVRESRRSGERPVGFLLRRGLSTSLWTGRRQGGEKCV